MQNRLGNIGRVFGITMVVFFLIDMIWIGLVARDFYAGTVGGMLRDSINWYAVLLFYFMYIGGMLLFVLIPALIKGSGVRHAALMGGLLGLFAFGTFNLTALSLLEGWLVTVVIVDMVWGAFLTAGTTSITLWIARAIMKHDRWAE